MKKVIAIILSLMLVLSLISITTFAESVPVSKSNLLSGAARVKLFIDTNGGLPNYVTLGTARVDMPSFLFLLADAVTQFSLSSNPDLTFTSVLPPFKSYESLDAGKITRSEYEAIAAQVKASAESASYQAPGYMVTSLGAMSYQSMIYMFSIALEFYRSAKYMPAYIEMRAWADRTGQQIPAPPANSVTPVPVDETTFTIPQIVAAAGRVSQYVSQNQAIPMNISITSTKIQAADFLSLAVDAVLNIHSKIFAPVLFAPANAPRESCEMILVYGHSGYLADIEELLSMAAQIKATIASTHIAPTSIQALDSRYTFGFETMVYAFSELLNFYSVNGVLPDTYTILPWQVVSGNALPTTPRLTPVPTPTPYSALISQSLIISGATRMKAYIENNKLLPSSITLGVTKVTVPAFLKLAADMISCVSNWQGRSLPLSSALAPGDSADAMTPGWMTKADYLAVVNLIIDQIETNGVAPAGVESSLGTVGYNSLVYMVSDIIQAYNEKRDLPAQIFVNDWHNIGALPPSTPTPFPTPTPTPLPPGIFTLQQVLDGMSGLYAQLVDTQALPASYMIAGKYLTTAEYFYLAAKTIQQLNAGNAGNVAYMAVLPGNNPEYTDSFNQTELSKAAYMNTIDRNINWITGTGEGYAANFVTYPTAGYDHFSGNFSYMRGCILYARILDYYNIHGALPAYISCDLAAQPNSTPSPVLPGDAEIWISADKTSVNVGEKVRVSVGLLGSTRPISYMQLVLPLDQTLFAGVGEVTNYLPYGDFIGSIITKGFRPGDVFYSWVNVADYLPGFSTNIFSFELEAVAIGAFDLGLSSASSYMADDNYNELNLSSNTVKLTVTEAASTPTPIPTPTLFITPTPMPTSTPAAQIQISADKTSVNVGEKVLVTAEFVSLNHELDAMELIFPFNLAIFNGVVGSITSFLPYNEYFTRGFRPTGDVFYAWFDPHTSLSGGPTQICSFELEAIAEGTFELGLSEECLLYSFSSDKIVPFSSNTVTLTAVYPPGYSPTPQSEFTVAEVAAAASQLTAQSRSYMPGAGPDTGGDMNDPASVLVGHTTVGRPAYFILMAKAILAVYNFETADMLPYIDYVEPNTWAAQTLNLNYASQDFIINNATRHVNFAVTNGRIAASTSYPHASYTGFESYVGQFNYVYATYIFAQALQYYAVNGSIPSIIDLPALPA